MVKIVANSRLNSKLAHILDHLPGDAAGAGRR